MGGKFKFSALLAMKPKKKQLLRISYLYHFEIKDKVGFGLCAESNVIQDNSVAD